MRYEDAGLRVCATVVELTGQGDKKHNDERLEAARRVLRDRVGKEDLVVLPAGYLRAQSEAEVRRVGRPILELAKELGLAVIFGVDSEKPRYPWSTRVAQFTLPSFLIGWSPTDSSVQVWRQRSLSGDDWRLAPEKTRLQPRALDVAGHLVVPVLGGEVFSPGIRTTLAGQGPTLAVLAAHQASGARHWAAQECLMWLGVPSVRSVHAADATTVLYFAQREVQSRLKSQTPGIKMWSFEVNRTAPRKRAA